MGYDISVGPSCPSTGFHAEWRVGPTSKADFVIHWLCGQGFVDVVTEFQEGIN
jgi:hypothetical protein